MTAGEFTLVYRRCAAANEPRRGFFLGRELVLIAQGLYARGADNISKVRANNTAAQHDCDANRCIRSNRLKPCRSAGLPTQKLTIARRAFS
jgi:hypothetical protein